MRSAFVTLALFPLLVIETVAAKSEGPEPGPPMAPIVVPKDQAHPGVIRVAVDATDTRRRIFRVHETIPVKGGKNIVLLYPQWLPGWHAPGGAVNRVAGLVIGAQGARVNWVRDPVDMYAFHVTVPANAKELEVDFQYLSPVNKDAGVTEVSANIVQLAWSSLVLYPAGYFARQIAVEPSIKLPDGWQFATALETVAANGATTSFKRVSLESLVDSPIVAGRTVARFDLDPGAAVPVHLDLFADRPEPIALNSALLDAHRALIQQAYKLFGAKHYDHYDFLVTVNDNIDFGGLEHHRCSENNVAANFFNEWDQAGYFHDLLPHEYVHSWNGKFRRPADLWTPNYNVPMRNSLLWVYEGLTEYWGKVLTARAGLWSKEQTLDALALIAAKHAAAPGRTWRALEDTTGDEIIGPRQIAQSWGSWQRYEDYYDEGLLIWLDADTRIRELSHGARSLDDLARSFFGIHPGSGTPVSYTFDDVVRALNDVQPFDWAAFLRMRVDAISPQPPLDGIGRGGYKLVYSDVASEYYKSTEAFRKATNLTFSLGLSVDKEGNVKAVLWDGPAFKAGLSAGVQIVAVNGVAFDPELLKDAIKAARTTDQGTAIELIVRDQDHFRVTRIDYQDGLRYPHLERDASQPARLDEILSARK